MKKKSIAARLGVVAMALTLATTSLTSGTLAKYQSEYTFDAKAMVAAWNTEMAVWDQATNKYYCTWDDTKDMSELAMYDTKTGEAYGVYNKKIAPGMSGAIKLMVRNYSSEGGTNVATDVDTDYKVYVMPSSNESPANLQFSYGSKKVVMTDLTKADDPTYGFLLAEGTLAGNKTGTGAEKEVALNWAWNYESSDTKPTSKLAYDIKDTADGEAAANITYKFTVVMTQANPATAHTLDGSV